MMVTHGDTIVSNRYSICICLDDAYTYSFSVCGGVRIGHLTYYVYVVFERPLLPSNVLWTCAVLPRICISSTLEMFNFRLLFSLRFHKTHTETNIQIKNTSCLLNIILTRQWDIAIWIKLRRTLSHSITTNKNIFFLQFVKQFYVILFRCGWVHMSQGVSAFFMIIITMFGWHKNTVICVWFLS